MYTIHLRKATSGSQLLWSKEQLLAGLLHYEKLYGRFPTSHEIDAFEYLPSARSIQRSYGGLVKLRQELLPDSIANYTIGEHRSRRASETYANGRDYERLFYEYLITEFEEVAIHEHKVIRPGNVNSDFYIYLSENTGVVIDIFYAESMINLVNVVNIKLKRYSLIEAETYLVVVGNPNIDHEGLSVKMTSKRVPLSAHIFVQTEHFFKTTTIPMLKLRSEFSK
jgi:hypothetical protein